MKVWRTLGALLQALVLGTALAAALAKLLMTSNGIAAFKYQVF